MSPSWLPKRLVCAPSTRACSARSSKGVAPRRGPPTDVRADRPDSRVQRVRDRGQHRGPNGQAQCVVSVATLAASIGDESRPLLRSLDPRLCWSAPTRWMWAHTSGHEPTSDATVEPHRIGGWFAELHRPVIAEAGAARAPSMPFVGRAVIWGQRRWGGAVTRRHPSIVTDGAEPTTRPTPPIVGVGRNSER